MVPPQEPMCAYYFCLPFKKKKKSTHDDRLVGYIAAVRLAARIASPAPATKPHYTHFFYIYLPYVYVLYFIFTNRTLI